MWYPNYQLARNSLVESVQRIDVTLALSLLLVEPADEDDIAVFGEDGADAVQLLVGDGAVDRDGHDAVAKVDDVQLAAVAVLQVGAEDEQLRKGKLNWFT